MSKLEKESKNHPPPEPVTMEELNKTLKQLKNNKATGPDNIPNEVFTKATNNTKKIYLIIINKIIETGTMAPWRNNQVIQWKRSQGKMLK